MKYFVLLLAVVTVFARSPADTFLPNDGLDGPSIYTLFEDNQQEGDKLLKDNNQELESLNIEDDDTKQPAVIPTSTPLCSINVKALTALINSAIDKKLARQPAVQMLYLSITSHRRVLTIQKINGGDFTLGPNLNQITIGNGLTARTSTILAYRPKYNDYHHTGLGAVFINLNKLFPCAAKIGIVPTCRRFTQEEDGFFQGKTITEAGDQGNNFGNAKTYGFVFEACPYLYGGNGCLPTNFQTVVTCLLPSSCR